MEDHYHICCTFSDHFRHCTDIQQSQMSRDLLPFLYAQLGYTVAANIFFTFLFIRKVLKMDKLGDNLNKKIPKKDWTKFGLIMVLIILHLTHIILAYSDSSYWMHQYANFSLVAFFFLINYMMQSYIVIKLVTKGSGRRYKPNFFFWVFCIIASIVETIVVNVTVFLLQKSDSKDALQAVLQIVIAILNFIVFSISLICDMVQPSVQLLSTSVKNSEHLRADSDLSSGRTIEDSIHKWDRFPPNNRLFVEFNQQFQINQDKSSLSCLFKLAVYVDEQSFIITKNDLQFIKFSLEFKKIFPNKAEAELPQTKRKFDNMMDYGEDRLKTYQNYLIELIGKAQFIVPCLLDFLEVPLNLRSKLLMSDFAEIMRKQTGDSSEDEKQRKPFFQVSAQRGNIILENPDFVEFIINRSLADIQQLALRLKEERRLTLDILPQSPKEEDLIAFFSIIVNRKSLWRTFSTWFRLDIQLQNKVFNYFDPWFCGFKNIGIDIIGHQIVFDTQSKIHTCYLVSITGSFSGRRSTIEDSHNRGIIIKKRYNEFNCLDKQIRRFMKRKEMNLDHLPALPPKFSPFGSKTSPKSRQMRFGHYMKGLLQIEGINHCIKLLQFLEFDRVNIIQEQKMSDAEPSEHSEMSYFSQFNEKH